FALLLAHAALPETTHAQTTISSDPTVAPPRLDREPEKGIPLQPDWWANPCNWPCPGVPINCGGPVGPRCGDGENGAGGSLISPTPEWPSVSGESFSDGVHQHRVLLHSGQEVWTEKDLVIKGRDHGVNLELMRRHQSISGARDRTMLLDDGELYFPMFGPAWSFNYQRYLVTLNDGVADDSDTDIEIYELGFDRVDTFRRIARTPSLGGYTKVWDGVGGCVDKVIWDGDDLIAPRLWRSGGLEQRFSEFVDAGNGRRIARLEELVSPTGNRILIRYVSEDSPPGTYTPSDPEWHQIAAIYDSWGDNSPASGREILFTYSPSSEGVKPRA
ncbi:MAG: hypothetical protein AAFQ53_13105, partial [Bacteroidota bacterium]